METSEPSGDQKFDEVDDIRTSVSLLLQKTLLTDVEFRVVVGTSERVFPAHKLILSCRSPILADRFYKEKDASVISETDVGPLGMEQMIRYIYLDDIDSYSAFALKQGLEASLKYSIKSLENLCISCLMNVEITGDNVYEVLDAADRVKHDGIRQRCLNIVMNDTETVLNSSALRHASLNTLVHIFELPELNIESEVRLLEAAIAWLQHNRNSSSRDKLLSCIDIMALDVDESEVRLLEAAIAWLQHNRNSSSRDKLLSCIDIMALDVDEVLAVTKKFSSFFSDSEIVSILSNIRHFGSPDLPSFCITHKSKRKFLKPKCKPSEISNLGVSNSATQTSDFIMLDKSTEISPNEAYFFPVQEIASVKTSLHAKLEERAEISEEEFYTFHSTESLTTGTQSTVVSTIDGCSQISKSEAVLFNRKETENEEVQTTSSITPNRSVETSDLTLRSNQITKIRKNDFDVFISSNTYDTEVQRTFVTENEKSSPALDVGTYKFYKNENENTPSSWPSLPAKSPANAKLEASRNVGDEKIRINFEDESRDVIASSTQISRKNNDMVSTSSKEDISDKTSTELGPVNRIRVDLIGEPSNKEELKIKFNVYDGTKIQELITYYTLLKASSTFFAQLFDDDHNSPKLSAIKLDDLSFKGLSSMIRFLEEYRLTLTPLRDFPEIWNVACRFGMDELQKYCKRHLENVPITYDTVTELMSLSSVMGLTVLHRKCKSFKNTTERLRINSTNELLKFKKKIKKCSKKN